jgi:phosphatidylinositol-3-phosphatase
MHVRSGWLLLCLAGALAGCGNSAPPPTPPPSTSPATAALGSHAHVMLIVEENHSVDQLIGNTQAPYINSLAARYGLATDWSDVGHPSLPNYLAYISGSVWGSPADTTPQDATYSGTTIVDELAGAGFTWKAYLEDMPTACDLTDQFGPGHYDVNHNPFLYFDQVRGNPAQCGRDVPYTQLATDLAANSAPDFAWVSPNTLHDMHDGTVQQGDAWLQGMLPAVLDSAWYGSGGVVIVTWDEGDTSEQVATIVISAHTSPGARLTTHGTEYGTLRTVEKLYGLGYIGASADAANGDLLTLLH